MGSTAMAFNGQRARERREELNMSQFDLIAKMQEIVRTSNLKKKPKLRPEYVSRHESGRTQPGRVMFVLYSKVLDLPLSELETL